jgi:hypothetical protein
MNIAIHKERDKKMGGERATLKKALKIVRDNPLCHINQFSFCNIDRVAETVVSSAPGHLF